MPFRSLVLLFFLLSCHNLSASVPIVLRADNSDRSIASLVDVFTDSTSSLPLSFVREHLSSFRSHNVEVLNLGIGKGSHWLHFHTTNLTGKDNLVLELQQPMLDEVDVFVLAPNGTTRKLSVSSGRSFYERFYQHQNYIFELPIKSGLSAEVFVRVYAEEAILLPLKLGTEAEVLQDLIEGDFLNGLYYGLMIVMLLYNLFVWYSLRDPLYLRYVFYVFSIGITQACLQGYGFRFLWPELPQLQTFAVPLAGVLSGGSTILFIRPFLHTRLRTPILDKILQGLGGLYLVALAIICTGALPLAYHVIDFGALAGALSIMAAAIIISMQGYRPAKFILVAWSLFLAAVVVFVLKDFDIVPYNNFTNRALLIGSGFETILLAIALADKINALKLEKEQSQAEKIAALSENERLVREQNVILEQLVTERTISLKESNESLSVALENLKETQSQLVDAEKMATLGQLTAGIAHEINNPINFVISNVQPLRRDFGDIKDVLDALADALNGTWTEEKAVKAKKLIAEIELDYILEEIDKLLDGIDEGARRTSEIVRGLRNFSRLDESSMKKASMAECIDSTLVLLNSMLKNRIEVEKQYHYLDPIDCLPGKVNQVFMNIITNAIQVFDNSPQHPHPIIRLEIHDADTMVRIVIADNGNGMPEEVRRHIFEPFYSTKEVGKGTGLGLSIVNNIIKSHLGHITVDSEVGKGTSFVILLPKKQTAPATQALNNS